jgi:hypothetical protein
MNVRREKEEKKGPDQTFTLGDRKRKKINGYFMTHPAGNQ